MKTKIAFSILIIAIFFTGFVPKWQLNTAQWYPGGAWTSGEEIQLYSWMKEGIPKNSNVYPLSTRDQNVIGMDMYSCKYCEGVVAFRKGEPLSRTSDEWYSFLRSNDYDYLLLDYGMTVKYGKKWFGWDEEEIITDLNELTSQISNDDRFQAVYYNQAGALLVVS